MNKIEVYENALELKLNEFICNLDHNPKIFTEPVEKSSYLNHKMYNAEEGFQLLVEKEYDDYLKYLDKFIEINTTTTEGWIYLESTLNRLLSKYEHAYQKIINSPELLEWKTLAKNFYLPNSDSDYWVGKQEKYTRSAYKFFYEMVCIQIHFLNKIIKYLRQQLPLKNSIHSLVSGNEESMKKKYEPEKYFFKIKPDFNITRIHNILNVLYRELIQHGFINCKLPEFKQVFISENPKPIVFCKKYIHLSYIIKLMNDKFLENSIKPSNYDIGIELFRNQTIMDFFNPKKIRHDKDPKVIDKKIIDRIISEAIYSNL